MASQIPYIDLHTHRNYPVSALEVRSIKNVALNHSELVTEVDCSVGLHPWYINGNTEHDLGLMANALERKQVLAIGECGIDKTIEIPLTDQQSIFDKQVCLAQKYQKPLIIHCVRAFEEIVSSLKRLDFKEPVIFHGYRKNWILGQQLIRKGYYLSIGQHCLNGSQDELLQHISLCHLFLETDTDTMIEINALYCYVAQVRSIAVEELKCIIYQNYKKVFNK
ncbi:MULTISPECIES: TatD family hydrolase [unclassified Sphingobacterium]|uniref:TatD family hydrolase n=1 Tax=unclassified Sphingobacterium TaxID=2609468 RepID=UPI0025F6FB1E|nr:MULTISPECIES: TatD family hydrolase [unclassified Sphingobacterium]